MNDRSHGAFWTTAAVVLAYGVAMGYLEAAVVELASVSSSAPSGGGAAPHPSPK